MSSKHFYELIERMKETHDRKSHDYANDADPFANFRKQAELVSWFNKPIDQAFAGIIAIKLARLSELLSGKEPKNESIDDTFLDLSNYCALWGSYYLSKKPLEKLKQKMNDTMQEMERRFPPTGHNDVIACIKCKDFWPNNLNGQENYIKHAIDMHSAIYNKAQKSLKFNDSLEVLPNMAIFTTNLEDKDIPF